MNLLLSFPAGLIRSLHINRFHKLSEHVWSQLRECAVFVYPVDKLLQVLCLSFLFLNFLLQTFDLGFEVGLLLGIVRAHHGKFFVIEPSGYIILVNTDEEAV